MWLWGEHDVEAARRALLHVPAIGPDLLARAQREMGDGWPLHLVLGAMTGVPYKLYAIEAGARHIDIAAFAAISFPARLIRFLLNIAVAAAGRWFALRIGKPGWMYAGWAIAWICVYGFYFSLRAHAS
jgi:membrane protein YqaA with SNARE-associated domain